MGGPSRFLSGTRFKGAPMNEFVTAVILGVVEGITEFLPVSSTGHLILVNRLTGFTGAFANTFDVVIQTGAILSVIVYFRERVLPLGRGSSDLQKAEQVDLWKKSIIGVLPAVCLGSLLGKRIEDSLFNPFTVAMALLIGGVALLLLERRKKAGRIGSVSGLSYKTVLLIGLIQCLAMVPGTSRSAATIIGAMLLGTTRVVAAEFSFFLAIPTLSAASAYALAKNGFSYTGHEILLMSAGFTVSFLVAWLVIAAFMSYISRRDFRPFGYYRIGLGILVLLYFSFKA